MQRSQQMSYLWVGGRSLEEGMSKSWQRQGIKQGELAEVGMLEADVDTTVPASAEGVLGGRFYKFTYEVEEVLIRNVAVEDTTVPVAHGGIPKNNLTPKRKRENQDKEDSNSASSGVGKHDPSFHGGKTCRLPPAENVSSESCDSDEDTSLLIESIKREHEEKTRDTSKWIVSASKEPANKSLGQDVGSQEVQETFSSAV